MQKSIGIIYDIWEHSPSLLSIQFCVSPQIVGAAFGAGHQLQEGQVDVQFAWGQYQVAVQQDA